MSIYTDNGYRSRKDYLKSLSEEYDVPLNKVITMADILGREEDFDGLVVALQDFDECDEEEEEE